MELFHPARFIRASISLTQIPPSSTPIHSSKKKYTSSKWTSPSPLTACSAFHCEVEKRRRIRGRNVRLAKFFDRVHRESLELFDYSVFDEQWKKRKEGKGKIFLLCVGDEVGLDRRSNDRSACKVSSVVSRAHYGEPLIRIRAHFTGSNSVCICRSTVLLPRHVSRNNRLANQRILAEW